MSYITVQISLYPLSTKDVSEKIDSFLAVLKGEGLEVKMGPMSSYIEGESEKVFDALKMAFEETSLHSKIVLTATFSNACPAWFDSKGGKEDVDK